MTVHTKERNAIVRLRRVAKDMGSLSDLLHEDPDFIYDEEFGKLQVDVAYVIALLEQPDD